MGTDLRRRGGEAVKMRAAIALALFSFVASPLDAQYRKIGELELRLTGLHAVATPEKITVPKNTSAGVRVAVRSGATDLNVTEAMRLLGGAFQIEGELSGPGLRQPILLPSTPSSDPYLVIVPPLPQPGDYTISNLRLTRNGATALDITPQRIAVEVIDQVLITSVTTRPLTLEEIQAKGIILDNNSYLGFEFTLGVSLDSKVTQFSFPVVFDKRGVAIPQPVLPASDPERVQMPPLTTIVPMLLKPQDGLPEPTIRMANGRDEPVRIPSVLVIPGNVGYLKQFFSAKLFVANGAPGGSGLTVHDVIGKIKLPPGADKVYGSFDDPLGLPDTTRGPQAASQPVRGVGQDGKPGTADDTTSFDPAQQGEVEFLLRGDKEGFHAIDFDVEAMLEGLLTGPVKVTGAGSGGVLVRNPYFDMTFTAPAQVRQGERFTVYVTVNNISQSIANDVRVSLDAARMSGVRLVSEATQSIPTLLARDSKMLPYEFISDRTGQLVATYLNFDTQNGTTGNLKFTLGIGERGIPLSPDTLVLPASVEFVPQSVRAAAMRVLGQAWSIANAPSGTLPANITRTSRQGVTLKALALAEAGLRISLGQPAQDAIRDLLFDFYGGSPLDSGFDQLLRQTNAGTELTRAIGVALQPVAEMSGGVAAYERVVAQIAASGPDFMTFAIGSASSAPVTLTITDAQTRSSSTDANSATFTKADVPSAVIIPLGTSVTAPRLGLIAAPAGAPYQLQFIATASGTTDLSVTVPTLDSRFFRGTLSGITLAAGTHYRIALQPGTSSMYLDSDSAGDGTYEGRQALNVETISPQGPRLFSATVIGPETLPGAGPWGFNAVLLFDRVVSGPASSNVANYTIAKNAVVSAKKQLSGRLVFVTLAQPEGPYVATKIAVANISDGRGIVGPPAETSLGSRLKEIGAVVSGRVLDADGMPAAGAAITYTQNAVIDCAPPLDDSVGLTNVLTGQDGRYELRYVRQDACGMPFQVMTRDLSTGALRSFSSSVRVPGEQIIIDIALFGRGSVTGVVRNLSGQPVTAANVIVVSQTDPQSSGAAATDTTGRYRIDNIIVGPVTVRAVKGASLGHSTGRIDRAGTAATVDLTLDGGTVRAAGFVRRLENGVAAPLSDLQVVYNVRASGGGFIPISVTRTKSDGSYAFDGLPTGEYTIEAALNSRDRATATGIAAAGDAVAKDLNIVIGGQGYGTVSGVVRFPDGTPAANVIAGIDDRGVLTSSTGTFELTGVVARVQSQRVFARSRDGMRNGGTNIQITQPGQVVSNVIVILSGVGNAEFTVLDANRNPVPDQEIALLGNCANPCGCAALKTGNDGRVIFTGLPLGNVSVRALRGSTSALDQAEATTSITADGSTGFGVLQFPGFGIVTGTILNPDGTPALGADVRLSARVFNEDWCSLAPGIAQRIRSDAAGKFRFTGVNIGGISVAASHPFYTTNVGVQRTIVKNGDTVDVTLKLVNTISGVLSGRVLLPDGTTPAGAGVEVTAAGPLPDVTVTTDSAGKYAFAKIFPEGNYTVTARDSATGGLYRESIYMRAGQDIARDLRLKGRGTVEVRVVNGAGQPVPNAFVRLEETEFPNRVYEAALEASNAGVATFYNVYEGRLTATASDPFRRGGRTSSMLTGPGTTATIQVALTTTGTVNGHFLKADRTTPIPFGTVRLIVNGSTVGQATTQGNGDIGSFTFAYVPAGPFRIEAQDPQTARSGIVTGSITSEGEIVTADPVAQGIGKVEGLVTSNGAPQPGAHVAVESGGFRASAIADAQGRYLFDGVPEGRIVASASIAGNFLRGTASGVLSGDLQTLTLPVALRDSGNLTGKVVAADGVTAAPLSLVVISVGGTGGATLSTTSDALGNFRFDRVPAGQASLTAEELGGLDRAASSTEVVGSATTSVTLRLNGVGSISGRALDSAGQPVGGDITIAGSGVFPYSFTVQSAADGSFALPRVLAGSFNASLRVKSGEFLLYGSATGSVLPIQTAQLTIQVQPSGTITGLVFRPDDTTPAAGSTITLDLDPNRGRVTMQAGTDGRFTARGVPLGAFTARFSDPITTGLAIVRGTLATNSEIKDLQRIVLDDKPVTVVAVNPADGAIGVPLNQPVTVTFSNALAGAAGVSLTSGTSGVASTATLSADSKTVTLTGTWPDAKTISVNVSTTVSDIYGRRPLSATATTFRTVDVSAPKVVSVVPSQNAIQVPGTAPVVVTFDENLAAGTNLSTLVALAGSAGSAATGTAVLTSPSVVTYSPSAPLANDSIYTVSVNGAIDLSGNTQTTAFTSSFATTDTGAPALLRTQPAMAWVNTAKPRIEFSASDTISGIAPGSGTLTVDGAVVVPSSAGSTISYTPAANMSEGSHEVVATVKDRAGNTASASGSFGIDTIQPGVPSLSGITDGQILSGTVSLTGSATDASSGVSLIQVIIDDRASLNLSPPNFTVSYNSAVLAEGPHTFAVRAVDVAGNSGPSSSVLVVTADNRPLALTVTAPVHRQQVRDSVTITATPSEPVTSVKFTLLGTTVEVAVPPYQATFDVSPLPDGVHTIAVQASTAAAEMASTTREFVVDRTPPSAPDGTKVNAEPPGTDGRSLVFGRAGAVEANAVVDIVNTRTAAKTTISAGTDGSFSVFVAGQVDDVLTLTATDRVGNRGASTSINVRRLPSLPPADGSTTLTYSGVLVDRVGTTTGSVAPDGALDAVFTMTMSIGQGVTRQLSYIDLIGNGSRSTRTTIPVLGVAVDAGAALLNAPDGQISMPIINGTTLTLFASDNGFIKGEQTYTVVAVFTDGSRFVATCVIEEAADEARVPHSLKAAATWNSVVGTSTTPGTTRVTLSNIRDIKGDLVPDGSKLGVSAATGSTRNPWGSFVTSEGGSILEGTPAPNNAAFKIFTITGGTVSFTYSSGSVISFNQANKYGIVQVIAADDGGNVVGSEVIGSTMVLIRGSGHRASIHADPPMLYADRADRRSKLSVKVNDTAGQPVPDGTKVLLGAAYCFARYADSASCISSLGGTIYGGTGANNRVFTVQNGTVQAEFSSAGLLVASGGIEWANVMILPADANGNATSDRAIGIYSLQLVGAGTVEVGVSPDTLPWVEPIPNPSRLQMHHLHDIQGNLVPDDAKILVTAAYCGSRLRSNGSCINSAGGLITDGIPSPSGGLYKVFSLNDGNALATYSTQGVAPVSRGSEAVANIQVLMADVNGAVASDRNIGMAAVKIVGAYNARASVSESTLFGDGRLQTTQVTFSHILDLNGNPLPEGSSVLVSAANCAARDNVYNYYCVSSDGGQIVNGDTAAAGAAYKLFKIKDGKVVATFGNQGLAVGPGQSKTSTIVLMPARIDGALNGTMTIAQVQVTTVGTTTAQVGVSPGTLHADGRDFRSTVTFSGFKDRDGRPVPDGTKIALSAANCAAKDSVYVYYCVSSDGGAILGGSPSSVGPAYREFAVTNGQIVAEYSSEGVVAVTEKLARVVALSLNDTGGILSFGNLATGAIRLVAPLSAAVSTAPIDLSATGVSQTSNVSVFNLRDLDTTMTVPDGAKVGLSVANCAARDSNYNYYCIGSVGGTITAVGTVPGDGDVAPNNPNFKLFTVRDGEVKATYTSGTLTYGIAETRTATVQVVAADKNGNILSTRALGFGAIQLHGATSATSSGPTTLPRVGGTATIVFSGIKDAVGNTVPDGTLVVATAFNCSLKDAQYNYYCVNSSGGTITNGVDSTAASFKTFTVTNGAISIDYSTAGVVNNNSSVYSHISITPATTAGAPMSTRSMFGGNHKITLTAP